MLTKTKIALSAFLVAGFASTALAYPVKISDRYPLLEQTYQQSAGAAAFASAADWRSVKSFTAAERLLFERASGAGLTW